MRAANCGSEMLVSDERIRSDACTDDMISAAATPLPATSASAIPMRLSPASVKSK